MIDEAERLREETGAVLATVVCALVGALIAALLLLGEARPLTGDGSLAPIVAAVAGAIAAAAFGYSTLRHRRGQTAGMPRWQAAVSHVSAVALTVAVAAVTAMGVLLAAEVLAAGLDGLRLGPVGGGLLAGAASALGGRFAYGAGIRLRTADLAGTLFAFLVIGTLFSMVTAVDPRWWEHNFSTLGGTGSWSFNGTLMVAGLLIATVGSYIGRDLHRMLGDPSLARIAGVVVLWALTGAALAAVGLLPLDRMPLAHDIAAFATLVLFVGAAVATVLTIPHRPAALTITTIGVGVLVTVAVLLCFVFRLLGVTALEAIVVGLGLLWITTFVRVIAILVPQGSRPSARAHPLRG